MTVFRSLLRTALAALTCTAVAGALGTPAGTAITNRASTTFTTPDTAQDVQVTSNAVVTTVQAVCAVSVAPDGSVLRPARVLAAPSGERAVFPYTVVNAGNAPQRFDLRASLDAASVAAPTLRLVLDADADGQPDADEPTVTAVTLAADASAAVLLVADTGRVPGDAWVNVSAACPGAGGQLDDNNVSQLRVGPPPQLAVGKTFTPAVIRPGAQTTVTVTATNGGAGDSREVTVTDDLGAQAAAGLVFVPGSARASAGTVEYSADGRTWTAAEPGRVLGVRARVPSVPAGGAVTLTFRMEAQPAAEDRVIPNTATVDGADAPVSATASVDVRYAPGVVVGPPGRPDAPELGPDDAQGVALAAVGQTVCFDHTVVNTGDVSDAYTVTVDAGSAAVTLYGPGGTPLAQPFTLDAGQISALRVCYAPAQPGALDAVVTVTGARGPRNATRDGIARVEAQLPELVKSAVATTTAPDGTPVTLPDGATVTLDDTVAYTLRVRNPYAGALRDVVVSDAVPAHLDVVDAGGGRVTGERGEQRVTWTLPVLAAGETRDLVLVTRVSARAVDGESLRNTFTFSSADLPGVLSSNEVRTAVWSAKLVISKAVSAKEATFGDLLTYTLQITNASTTTDITDAVITDTPVAGLEYVPGSSAVDAAPVADPAVSGGALRWTVAKLRAGQTVGLTYRMRVTPAASGDLVNTVEVTGTGAGGTARAVASNRATATTKLSVLRFAPLSDIAGVVYVDRNRNGRYDALLDTPVPRARILLAGGRQALTDDRGRYSFLNVPNGTHAVRLDPSTTPYPPLHVPRDGGLAGTQTVNAAGLTGVDFPLAPLGADVTAVRRTTLRMGDVTVHKAVYADGGVWVVTLTLSTPAPLRDVQLLDPLPAGATLKDGGNTFAATVPAGDTTVTYSFVWNGDPRAATTDPTLTWSP